MHGLLIVNEFLSTEKFKDIYSRLEGSFRELGVSLSIRTNADFIHAVNSPLPLEQRPDFVLFWDKDVLLAREFEDANIPVFNSSCAIALCDDKAKTHLALRGLPMPKTIISPMTFPNIGFTNPDFLEKVGRELSFPIVVKECFGSFGAQVYLASNKEELIEISKAHENVPLIFQELVEESFGRDVRISVVGHRVVAAMLRTSENGDFRSNVTLGGTTLPYSPTDEEVGLAEAASRRLGLSFAGVDILFGKDGPLICEVNSNAHFKSTYDCTGVDLADLIASHIVRKLRAEI